MREDLTRLGQDVHALAYRLHPSILNDLGLPEALKAECESFSQTQSLKIDVSVAQVPENVSDDVGLGLFRIAQESLRNVARHASAGQVEVRLRHLNGGLQLTVRDDGIGFDPTQAPIKASLGLASMRQRAALVGGKLKIDGKPSHGTTITAWVPLLGGHGFYVIHGPLP
jgi:signal transduction histidine kinase